MAKTSTPATTRMLAEFVTGARLADLSDAVRREGVRTWLNWVGCALGGSRHESVEIAIAAAEEFAPERRATVIGRGTLLSDPDAAFVNCLASSAWVFDDTHLKTVTHPTGPVAAALLPLAERRKISGGDFLLALVLGIEIECRLATALTVPPARGNVGWYITGVTGGIGAAAGAARLLGLDVQHTIWALGIAAATASGFRQTHATMSVGFVPGHAARCGLQAALLAARGFTCSDRIIEGPAGFADVFADKANLAAATDGLGTVWETLENAYKPYPCGIVIHPAIDACLDFAREPDFDPSQIEEVRLGVHPLCLTLCDRPAPADGQVAQVSLQHWTAAALARGAAGIPEGLDECVQAADVIAVRDRVKATADTSVGRDGAVVTLAMRDGSTRTRRIEHGIGSLERPMSDMELDGKFLGQAALVGMDEKGSRTLLNLCRRLPELPDVAETARRSVV